MKGASGEALPDELAVSLKKQKELDRVPLAAQQMEQQQRSGLGSARGRISLGKHSKCRGQAVLRNRCDGKELMSPKSRAESIVKEFLGKRFITTFLAWQPGVGLVISPIKEGTEL